MTHRADVARGRDIVARWSALAEQRLEYLTELFETGRWRRYHSELAFLENIREAKSAVETWHDLATREASRDNSAVDISWLGRARATLPRDVPLRSQVHRFQPLPARLSAEPPPQDLSIQDLPIQDLPIPAEARHVVSDEAPSAPDSDTLVFDPASNQATDPILDQTTDPAFHKVFELALEMTSIQDRYPLLRNAL
jgi:uncharacterized repeat protein (TIGR03809 family)